MTAGRTHRHESPQSSGFSRHLKWLGLVALLALSACSDAPTNTQDVTQSSTTTVDSTEQAPSAPQSVSTPDGSAFSPEACEARFGHPCLRRDTDPAVLALHAEYTAEVASLSRSESREAAFEWVQQQPSVVDAHLSGTVLMFRVDGGQPVSIITPIPEPPPGYTETVDAMNAFVAGGASPIQAIRAKAENPTVGTTAFGVVGEGTDRDNPQNRKNALFIEPWASDEGSLFSVVGRARPRELLGDIPDYAYPNSVVHTIDTDADPFWFTAEIWRQYDYIYVSTHGGTWDDGAVLESGVRELWDGANANYQPTCDRLIEPYLGLPGVECGVQQLPNVQYITVDMNHVFFTAQYFNPSHRLEKAVVYIEACESLKHSTLAATIVADSSAYLGWTDFINLSVARDASAQLLVQMTKRERNVGAALDTMCAIGMCGGDRYRDPNSQGGAPFIKTYENGLEAKKLRLYDVPTARDPGSPTSIGPGLQDGAELQTQGSPGDEQNDKADIAVDLMGVIDPDEIGNEFVGDAMLAAVDDPASLYNLKFFINDVEVGRDNLATKLNPTATVTQFDDSQYRYVFTADLPFDVAPEGTEATLKIEVGLPEGGVSDYEVDVVFVPGGAGAVITIGSQTFEFELVEFFGQLCQVDEDDTILQAAGFVDGDPEAGSFSAHIEPDGQDVEGLFSVHGITVDDPENNRTWMADDLEFPMQMALAAIPEGGSQIDTVTIENGRAFGTATFIDTQAARDAWLYNTPFPASVSGTFDIRCN